MTNQFAEQERTAFRIDCDDGSDTALDDLAIGGVHVHMVRIERMDSGHFWGAIYLRDGRTIRLGFNSKRRISCHAEIEP